MFKRIYFFFLTYLAAMVYSQTLLMLWFLQNGISHLEMLVYFLVSYLLTLLIYVVLEGKTFSSRSALLCGIASSAAAVFMANFITPHRSYIYVMALLFAMNGVFFWTIYNTLHFKYSEKHEHGFKSGAYFLLVPILSLLLAPLAGLVVEKFGFHFLFSSSMVLYLLPFLLVFSLPVFDFKFDTRDAVTKIEHPVMVIFQGYIFMLTYNVVPIFTLFFLTTPMKLGNFFGYLAVFAALAALLSARMSDKFESRAHFFYIFTFLNALSYLPLFFSRSLMGWQIFSGINNLTYGLAKPFDITLTLDHARLDMMQTMLGRDFYHTAGRAVMILLLLLVWYLTSSLWSALVWSALVPLCYPVVAYYNRVYLKSYGT